MLDFIEGTMKSIKAGNKNGGAKILNHFVECKRKGIEPKAGVECFVVGCLAQIVECYFNGKKPDYDSIFCIGQIDEKTRRPRLPLSTKIERERKIFAKVSILMEDGNTRGDSIAKVAKELAMSISTVEKCYDNSSKDDITT